MPGPGWQPAQRLAQLAHLPKAAQRVSDSPPALALALVAAVSASPLVEPPKAPKLAQRAYLEFFFQPLAQRHGA